MTNREYPHSIYSGKWSGGHCQGIAVDRVGGYMYFSFTTALVKTDLKGNVIGSAQGLKAHLGCIAFRDEDGCLYGSLEYKNDEIGQGIEHRVGERSQHQNAFYVARFDVGCMNRVGMDVFDDGIMVACHLLEVVNDYEGSSPDGTLHVLGCSGIDGITFAPMFGESRASKRYLFVAYGVYGDTARTDNDYQVLLCYDPEDINRFARPLNQDKPHTSGPEKPYKKLFVYTGNTTYGVQNMEYDAYTGDVLLAVYVGEKPQFPNRPMYIIDGRKAPVMRELRGVGGRGLVLTLSEDGLPHESGVRGFNFEYGSTGLCALGGGAYYVSHDERDGEEWSSTARLYRWNGNDPLALV